MLYTLIREDVDASEKSVIQQANELQGLSTEKMVEVITAERRFSRRFNFVFHEKSPEVSLLASKTGTGFWKSMPWFGTFMDKEYPWIYHVDLGWLYSSGTNTGDIWFYSDSLKLNGQPIGWFWTNKHIFEGPTVSEMTIRITDLFILSEARRMDNGREVGHYWI